MNNDDEVPNNERSPGAARVAAVVMLIYVIATVTGTWWVA